jgi:hypothetical protein
MHFADKRALFFHDFGLSIWKYETKRISCIAVRNARPNLIIAPFGLIDIGYLNQESCAPLPIMSATL